MAERIGIEVHRKRFVSIIADCGSVRQNSESGADMIILVFQNDETACKPFALWGKDGVPYSRAWINRFEREGWLVRKGVDDEAMTLGGRHFRGTSFHLTDDGQEMLDTQADLLLPDYMHDDIDAAMDLDRS